MFSTRALTRTMIRNASTLQTTKAAGDISSVFPSLSGKKAEPLPQRFADLKQKTVGGKEDVLQKSWMRLLKSLENEIKEINDRGSNVMALITLQDLR